ncbi:hypothetical protein ES707_03648 [subsurface metagenome]
MIYCSYCPVSYVCAALKAHQELHSIHKEEGPASFPYSITLDRDGKYIPENAVKCPLVKWLKKAKELRDVQGGNKANH